MKDKPFSFKSYKKSSEAHLFRAGLIKATFLEETFSEHLLNTKVFRTSDLKKAILSLFEIFRQKNKKKMSFADFISCCDNLLGMYGLFSWCLRFFAGVYGFFVGVYGFFVGMYV
jgi:hypothetical protein